MMRCAARGLELCALNCSGNPLAYEKEMDVTKKTFALAQMLGVKKIVMMSGLPAGCKGDKTPVWDHHLMAAGDAGDFGIPVGRGCNPCLEGNRQDGGGLRR